jgi:CoA:oxalate CoA-transferase
MQRPLEGVKVLDFTRWQAGPHATVMLADLGAEVLKVEQPGDGDMGRQVGRQPDGFCAYFEANNRSKRSLTLNLRSAEAKTIVGRLIQEYDIVTENFRPSFMDSIGLGYDDLRKMNPRVIYAASSGFGPKGPWRDRGNYDLVVQGWGGAMVAQGGGPDNAPQVVRFSLGDQTGSMIFAFAIQAAIIARLRYGVGQRVDSSMVSAQLTMQHSLYVRYLRERRQVSISPDSKLVAGNGPTWTFYQAGDGKWFTLAIIDPEQWAPFCHLVGRPELITDPRSETPFSRLENFNVIYGMLAETFNTQPRGHWLDCFYDNKIVAGPINDIASIVDEDQVWINDYLVMQPHPHFGEIGVVGVPYSLSETPVSVGPPAPELGQHTEEVLLQAGFTWKDIERLRMANVI